MLVFDEPADATATPEATLAQIETILTQQGFGPTLPGTRQKVSLIARVRELITRYTERGTRIEELGVKVTALSRPRRSEEAAAATTPTPAPSLRELKRLRALVEAKTKEGDQAASVGRKLRHDNAELEKRLATVEKARQDAEQKLRIAESKAEKATRHASKKATDKAWTEQCAHDPAVIFEAATGRSPRPKSAADAQALKVAKIGLRHRQRLEDAVASLEQQVDALTTSIPAREYTDIRPTMKQWREAQRHIEDLELRLTAATESTKSVMRERELRKYMATAALVERDRLNYRLNLHELDSIPRTVSASVLKELCRTLEITDISELSPAVAKLVAACSAIPRLDKFARDVTDLVQAADKTLPGTFRLLKRWKEQRDDVAEALAVREKLKMKLGDQDDIVAALDAVIHEKERATTALAAFASAQTLVDHTPEAALSFIVSHLQTLFDVKTADGLVPRLNQLYLRHAELEAFARDLHAALSSLDPDLPFALPALLARTRAILHTEEIHLPAASAAA